MPKYSKEEKAKYFKKMREKWQVAKVLAEKKGHEIDAIIMSHGLEISRTGFMIVQMQMEEQELEGLPYLDAKTFKGWKENGFQVKRGESSTLQGITWLGAEKKEAKEGVEAKAGFTFPKCYHLFHRSQVEAIE